MVIGEKFVWAHMPKTGGNTTAKMFELFKDKLIHFDELSEHNKHDTFTRKEKKLNQAFTDKSKILNIRRLANWTLSLAQHQKRYSNIDIVPDEMSEGKIRITDGKGGYKLHRMDDYIKRFMCGNVDYWLRTEHINADFVKVMSQFFPITDAEKKDLEDVRVNVNNRYKKGLELHFTPTQIEKLYLNSPFWADLEKRIYGNTIFDLLENN